MRVKPKGGRRRKCHKRMAKEKQAEERGRGDENRRRRKK